MLQTTRVIINYSIIKNMMIILRNFFRANKKVLFDIFLNITAATLPLAMLQLIIYPRIARKIGGNEYGLMLTIYSIWIIISNSMGNVLNNIKLLKMQVYQKQSLEGDVPILLRKWISMSSVIVFMAIWIYCGEITVKHVLVGTLISTLIFLKAYLEVEFRIILNYYHILVNNLLLCFGYLAGYFLFTFNEIWECIFLCGYLFSCIYCIFNTRLLSEPCKKTTLYQQTEKDACSLVLSAIIINLTNYADKLVLYPLLGGLSVSIYYTATILGKITAMITGPVNNVFLSYIARWDRSKTHVFTRVLFIGTIVGILGYIIAIILARPFLEFFFPQWIEESMQIIPLTTITMMLTVLTSLLQPFVLKYCKMYWQISISAISSVVYFSCALFFYFFYGLYGFCIGTILGMLTKLSLMIYIYYKSIHME